VLSGRAAGSARYCPAAQGESVSHLSTASEEIMGSSETSTLIPHAFRSRGLVNEDS
jgi:hypothetical protein